MKRDILVICYSFPPYHGIGGRRWAKFAKYFAKRDYIVHVIHAKPLNSPPSLWMEDVWQSNIIKHPIKFPLQGVLNNPSPDFLQKIAYRIVRRLMMLSKYSPFDNASLARNSIVNKSVQLIRQYKIKDLIVSGGPSEYYFGSIIKKRTGVNLILDYRDLYSDHSFFDTYWKWTNRQKKYWEQIENLSINSSDAVVTVDDSMIDVLKKRCTNPYVKFVRISNGFDMDDYRIVPDVEQIRQDTYYTLWFAGGIALDLAPFAKAFFYAFHELKKNNPVCYNKFRIIICGNIESSVVEYARSLGLDNLKVENKIIERNKYVEMLYMANAGIVFLSKEYAGAFITKFYDYLYLKKIIINVGCRGVFSEFIGQNKIGLTFFSESDWTFFITLLHKLENKESNYLSDEYIGQCDIKYLSGQYIKLIDEISSWNINVL